ncbi:hypothetical protein F4778DRAFT_787768 [Xylariomycetidae sp. FL2044]|nr:hypothetical protein F4778DRAFT_787768 [Xylariomycetidae sp. FL2044]
MVSGNKDDTVIKLRRDPHKTIVWISRSFRQWSLFEVEKFLRAVALKEHIKDISPEKSGFALALWKNSDQRKFIRPRECVTFLEDLQKDRADELRYVEGWREGDHCPHNLLQIFRLDEDDERKWPIPSSTAQEIQNPPPPEEDSYSPPKQFEVFYDGLQPGNYPSDYNETVLQADRESTDTFVEPSKQEPLNPKITEPSSSISEAKPERLEKARTGNAEKANNGNTHKAAPADNNKPASLSKQTKHRTTMPEHAFSNPDADDIRLRRRWDLPDRAWENSVEFLQAGLCLTAGLPARETLSHAIIVLSNALASSQDIARIRVPIVLRLRVIAPAISRTIIARISGMVLQGTLMVVTDMIRTMTTGSETQIHLVGGSLMMVPDMSSIFMTIARIGSPVLQGTFIVAPHMSTAMTTSSDIEKTAVLEILTIAPDMSKILLVIARIGCRVLQETLMLVTHMIREIMSSNDVEGTPLSRRVSSNSRLIHLRTRMVTSNRAHVTGLFPRPIKRVEIRYSKRKNIGTGITPSGLETITNMVVKIIAEVLATLSPVIIIATMATPEALHHQMVVTAGALITVAVTLVVVVAVAVAVAVAVVLENILEAFISPSIFPRCPAVVGLASSS